MHAVVVDSLEEYLAGALNPADQRRIEAHLSECGACRGEVSGMQEISGLFGLLQSQETVEPGLGFYSGVMRKVGEQRPAASVSGLFGWDFAFGRRLVFASLMTLAVLGSYLVSRETGYSNAPSPEAVMADRVSTSFESAPGPDKMLITLAAYER